MIESACIRCGENLVDPTKGCMFCWGERLDVAVKTLVNAAESTDNAALVARVDAIDTLRSLGFSSEQVVHARARALDGHDAGEIAAQLKEQASEMAGVV